MRVGNQIGLGAGGEHQGSQYLAMSVSGWRNPSNLRVEPRLDLTPGPLDRLGALKHPRIRDDPKKSKEACPWEANLGRPS